mmetsp:Transcript_44641/g.105883  ORF Transcript_44641/g.105883 Transcript_44641/m.105883 type:complete len:236 (+) Transcript_44641:1269-1976(+)
MGDESECLCSKHMVGSISCFCAGELQSDSWGSQQASGSQHDAGPPQLRCYRRLAAAEAAPRHHTCPRDAQGVHGCTGSGMLPITTHASWRRVCAKLAPSGASAGMLCLTTCARPRWRALAAELPPGGPRQPHAGARTARRRGDPESKSRGCSATWRAHPQHVEKRCSWRSCGACDDGDGACCATVAEGQQDCNRRLPPAARASHQFTCTSCSTQLPASQDFASCLCLTARACRSG